MNGKGGERWEYRCVSAVKMRAGLWGGCVVAPFGDGFF